MLAKTTNRLRPIMKVFTRPWLINSHALVFPMSNRRHIFRTLTAKGRSGDGVSLDMPVLQMLMSLPPFARTRALWDDDMLAGAPV